MSSWWSLFGGIISTSPGRKAYLQSSMMYVAEPCRKIDFGKVVRVHFDGFEILVLFVMHLKSGCAHLLIFVFVDFHKYII